MNITGIPDADRGIVSLVYTVNIPGSTMTNEDGEIVEIPAISDERTISRDITFTQEQ